MNSNIPDQTVEGQVPTDKCFADRREAECAGAAEEGMVEELKDEMNVGKYCGHCCLC